MLVHFGQNLADSVPQTMSWCLNRPLAVTEMVKPQNLQIVYHFGVLHKEFSHRIYCVTFITVDAGALVRESGAVFPTRWG